MPEAGNSNVELAHHLGERNPHSKSFEADLIEIAEALVLATVAIATAWSGYQAALWTGRQAERYGEASRLRVEAEEVATESNQERLYVAATVVEWLKAEAQGQTKLADLFERRMLPGFKPAFEAWKKTDPIHNPNAPPGPQLMSGFRSPKAEQATNLNSEAVDVFEEGNQARQMSDDYVRTTVMLATVLLLIAVSQRFKVHSVRVAVLVFSALLLCFPIYSILRLPRA